MTSGGARLRSGPAPLHDALHRERDGKEWTKLPRQCSKPTPDWPMEIPDPEVVELTMWDRLWTMPQAHIWHEDRGFDQVAIYVRTFIEGAVRDASSSKRTLLRQQADALYLTPLSLAAGKYVITDTPEAEMLARATASHATGAVPGARRGRPSGTSTRSRMLHGVPDVDADEDEPEEDGEE